MRPAFALTIVAGSLLLAGADAHADVDSNVGATTTDVRNGATAIQTRGSWVIVPIPVSNPTFGNGLELGAIYLHAPGDGNPPATSGIGGMVTDNGSKVIGLFHDQSFDQDRYRLTGLVGTGRLEFEYYGIGADSPFADHPVGYEFTGTTFRLTGLARLSPASSWFAGLNLQQAYIKVKFDIPYVGAALPDLHASLRLGGLAPELMYDSRDDKTFPTRGQLFTVRWFDFRSAWGSQIDYDKLDVDYSGYRSLTPALVGAVRGRVQAASDSTPFFDLPGLDLRGASRDRYRDLRAVTVHGELRYAFLSRWGLLGFLEAGRDAGSFHELGSARTIVSVGGGLRWQASADRRLYLGIDAAVTNDASAVFIGIGERF